MARETDRLVAYLRLRQPIDAAIASGRVRKTKMAEAWLYHPADISLAVLRESAARETDRLLAQRLVVPLGIMSGMISSSISPSCSKAAARALLHQLVSSNSVERLGLLTAKDEPHLALYRLCDGDEVARQLDAISSALASRGQLRETDLPEPLTPRDGRAWAGTLLDHAEFAGWGYVAATWLRGWPQP